MKKAALIVAGGHGARMQSSLPKQFMLLGEQPVIVRTVNRFLRAEPEIRVFAVLPAEYHDYWTDHCARYFSDEENARIATVEGADTRAGSVWAGLQAWRETVQSDDGWLVAVHDAVRPMAGEELIRKSYAAAETEGAAILCVPVKSSLRRRTPEGSAHVPREDMYEVQTPQVFRSELLLRAYRERPHDRFTDDASLVETVLGADTPIALVEGDYANLKLTTPDDLAVLERLLEAEG